MLDGALTLSNEFCESGLPSEFSNDLFGWIHIVDIKYQQYWF